MNYNSKKDIRDIFADFTRIRDKYDELKRSANATERSRFLVFKLLIMEVCPYLEKRIDYLLSNRIRVENMIQFKVKSQVTTSRIWQLELNTTELEKKAISKIYGFSFGEKHIVNQLIIIIGYVQTANLLNRISNNHPGLLESVGASLDLLTRIRNCCAHDCYFNNENEFFNEFGFYDPSYIIPKIQEVDRFLRILAIELNGVHLQ